MNATTIILLIAFDGYLAYLVVRARQGIWRFGPLMAAGVAAGVVAVVLGQIAIVRKEQMFATLMAAAAAVAVVLIIWALWRAFRT